MFDIEVNKKLKELLHELEDNNPGICLILKSESLPINVFLRTYKEHWTHIPVEELLRGFNFKFKEDKKYIKKYSKDFESQLEKLRLIQKELEYQNILKRTIANTTTKSDDPSLAEVNKEIKEQFTTIINILITVFGVIYGIWYVSGTSSWFTAPYRILLCLFSGVIVLIADVSMYNMYYRKIKEAKISEKTRKEKRQILKRIVI